MQLPEVPYDTEVTYDPITIIIFILPLHYYLLPLVNKYTRNVLQYGHVFDTHST